MDKIIKYIEITKGEEFHPYITDHSQDGTNELAYFSDVYKAAGRCIVDITNATKTFSIDDNPQSTEYDQYMNNIVAFAGERGQGKTGALLSFRKMLIQYRNGSKQDDNFHVLSKIGECSFHSLDVIDPSMFNHNSNILQVIIARMFDKFKTECKKRDNDNTSFHRQREVMEKFQNVFGFVNQMMETNKAEKSQFYDDSTNTLIQISDAANLRRFMHDLVKDYLAFMNHGEQTKFLVIPVDDIDVNIEYAYQMAEQLRKYLIIPNVIILMALKIEQLSDAIFTHYCSMLNATQNFDKFEIKKMAERYIEKFIPNGRKIYLPDIRISAQSGEDICLLYYNNAVSRKNYHESAKTEEDKEKYLIYWSKKDLGNSNQTQNIQDSILGYIYECTRLSFRVPGYGIHPLMPETMRELVGLLAVLSHTEKIDSEFSWTNISDEKKKIIENNISLFESYFINTWVPSKLNEGNAQTIYQLNQTNDFQKHRYIITQIYDIIYNGTYFSLRLPYQHEKEAKRLTGTAYEDDVKGFAKKTENPLLYTLGDVMDSAARLTETIYDAEITAFVSAIRTVYTITMHKLLLASNGDMDTHAKKYAKLVDQFKAATDKKGGTQDDDKRIKSSIDKEFDALITELNRYEPNALFKFVGGDIFGNRIDQTLRMISDTEKGRGVNKQNISRTRFKLNWDNHSIPLDYASLFCTMTVYDSLKIQYDKKYKSGNNQDVQNGYYNISYPLVNALDLNIPLKRLGSQLLCTTNFLTQFVNDNPFKVLSLFLITNMDYLESLLQYLIVNEEGSKDKATQYKDHFKIFYSNIKNFTSETPSISFLENAFALTFFTSKDRELKPLWDFINDHSSLPNNEIIIDKFTSSKVLLELLQKVNHRDSKDKLLIKAKKALDICSVKGYTDCMDELLHLKASIDSKTKSFTSERNLLNAILQEIKDKITQAAVPNPALV